MIYYHFAFRISAYILACTVIQNNGQLLKIKDDKSCSTKMAVSLRYHSILIAKDVIDQQNGVSDLTSCAKLCFELSSCTNHAYREAEASCLLFKNPLREETISRLLFNGWQYGRVTSGRKVYLPSWDFYKVFCD